MQQTLDRSPLLLEFKRILAEEESGILTVEGEGFSKKLVFCRGRLTAADSTDPGEGLTAILQDCGLISGDVLEDNDDRFAALLVNRGVLQHGEVAFAKLHRIRIIALSLFSLAQGEWTFHSGPPPASTPKGGTIHLADILSDAVSSIKTHYYFREIFSRSHPRFVDVPRAVTSRVYERQKSLFNRLRKVKDCAHREILSRLDIPEEDYWETLILFYLLGGVVFPEAAPDDTIKRRREMVIRWRDRGNSGELDYHDLLGIEENASSAEVEAAFLSRTSQFHPERLDLDPDSELYGAALEILDEMKSARDLLAPRSRTAPPRKTMPSEEEENPVKRAQVLFQEALECKGQKRYADAANCLDRAIHLDPERAKYYFQLGVCQMHLPAFRKNAEQNLLKASEMEPWNAEPAYTLGVMFRSAGLRRMSEKYFRMALEINMDHTKAGKALREMTGTPQRRGRKGKGFFS